MAAGSRPFAPEQTKFERARVLEAAVERLTRALLTADDDAISELVAERRVIREELRVLRNDASGVVRLDEERVRRR